MRNAKPTAIQQDTSAAQTGHEVQILNGQHMVQLYYADEGVNATMFDRLKYLYAPDCYKQEISFVILDGAKVVAVAGIEQFESDDDSYVIKHVSVDPDYQGQGMGRALLESAFAYAAQSGKMLAPSSFTEEGQRLKHIVDELNAMYPDVDCHRPHRNFHP